MIDLRLQFFVDEWVKGNSQSSTFSPITLSNSQNYGWVRGVLVAIFLI